MLRSQQWCGDRENARTSVFDEQMRSGPTRYPVDRYLDPSSKRFEMVDVINEDIWNIEPALRPEDEIILRKLHDMLQSTAEDLKLLSGELSKFHEPGVQVKSQPIPLDEEFNEKVHIEEVVNAKFHGYNIVDPTRNIPKLKQGAIKIEDVKINNNSQNNKVNNKTVEEKKINIEKKSTAIKKLGISRTRIMQINGEEQANQNSQKLNNGKVLNNAPAVGYNEFCYTYTEPKVIGSPRKVLKVQDMPSINIRSELKLQSVLQLDIIPETNAVTPQDSLKNNVSVISVCHEVQPKDIQNKDKVKIAEIVAKPVDNVLNNKTVRKVSRMSTCESSGSTTNVSSDARHKLVAQKRIAASLRNSPKTSARARNNKITTKNEPEKRRPNLDEWKRRLNSVYGATTSKKSTNKSKDKLKLGDKQQTKSNIAEYIPYSKLTIGGVRASDIEKEIKDLPNKNEVDLSPIINDILSRENSFHKNTPRTSRPRSRILSTSDENLLQEVLDIERSVTETISKNLKIINKERALESADDSSKNSDEIESYDDDFEDDKSQQSVKSVIQSTDNSARKEPDNINREIKNDSNTQNNREGKNRNTTFTVQPNLSFKDSVDVFEFIHSVDTQDTATQSNTTNKISLKETQTSPNHNDNVNIQPIHNDLWPSIDPRREVEKLFEMEKEFIKKLIIDEYGDILEKNINKPSTSKESSNESRINVTTLQKNTQTSPAHVKSVMTSPKNTKTRTTSPYNIAVPVHQQTSPIIFVSEHDNGDESQKIEILNETDDISINLSSPRFSLRLPRNSKEVLSNLECNTQTARKTNVKRDNSSTTFRKTTISSSSSVDADNSSSELSSLGEIKIKRRLRKKVPSTSESSSNSTLSKYSIDLQCVGIVPLRSEGELSLGQISKNKSRYPRPSDGETSFGPK